MGNWPQGFEDHGETYPLSFLAWKVRPEKERLLWGKKHPDTRWRAAIKLCLLTENGYVSPFG